MGRLPADDAVIRGDGARLRASGEAGSKWRRAYGYMLPVSGVSRWAIRIDSSRGNQGMMYFGVSHVSKVGTCEWACSPFYGRLVRKCWNMDGALLVRSSPPEGFPDFHLKSVLCDEEGQPTDLDGRAASNVIELTLDADAKRRSGSMAGPRHCNSWLSSRCGAATSHRFEVLGRRRRGGPSHDPQRKAQPECASE